MTKFYQQGDVLLKVVAAMPANVERVLDADLALQHGETTGHMHRFDGNAAVEIWAPPAAERRLLSNGRTIVPGTGKFVVVKEPALLRHEEHKPIEVPPGIYEMDLVREYDYDNELVRRVAD
jgi:hypothetical protein